MFFGKEFYVLSIMFKNIEFFKVVGKFLYMMETHMMEILHMIESRKSNTSQNQLYAFNISVSFIFV